MEAAALKVLQASAVELRGRVDAVAGPSRQLARKRVVTMDGAAACEVGTSGEWPQRWGYGVTLVLPNDDFKRTAETAVRTLRAEGWTIKLNSSTGDVLDADALRDGLMLHISGEPNPSSLVVEGFGICIGADGRSTTG